MKAKVYVDGGARGNPGPAAVGGVVEIEGGKRVRFGKYIGRATNNIAEYRSALEGLRELKKIAGEEKRGEAVFYMDSRLVVNQLNGLFKIKNSKLREEIVKVREAERELGWGVRYKLVPREENKEADYLVNKVLDERGNNG